MNTVFVSYSHRDEIWKDKLLPHLKSLEQAGVKMKVWQDRRINAGAKWYPEIQEAMADSAAAILLVSADYLASGFCIKEEVPFLLRRQEEQGMLLIPVLVRQCLWKAHRWLAGRQMLPRDGKCVAIDFPGDKIDAVFSDVAGLVFNHFERLATTPQAIPLAQPRETPKWPALPPDRIDLLRLSETGSALFGRDEELKLLDTAWSLDPAAGIRVLVFTAYGGVGKSTLINHWLDEMKRHHFRGATRVFGWSFYSQGVRDHGAPSAEPFIAAALRFFGDPDPAAGFAWDKGERLARLVGAERALLVLDGLEPLQSAQSFDRGKLRDPGLEALLRGLTRHASGLCLITSREPLADLAGRHGVEMRDLEQITPRAGRALLRTARVTGTDVELEALAQQFGPHALAVSLLAVYLHEQPGRGVSPAQAIAQLSGKTPLDRVLTGFAQWLGNSPELAVLRLLGFFDRPADEGSFRALRTKPAIAGLTGHLVKLKKPALVRVLSRLERLRLIHVRQCDSGRQVVDAHPLIREYFAKEIREQAPAAWAAGHKRLFEHLCATTKEGNEPSLEELQPLYQAVAHGCQAGLHEEACDKLYHARILRGGEFYSTKQLGAFGSDLGAVTCFFETPWQRVSPVLAEDAQAWLLNEAAFRLRGLGRLTEALEPMRVSGEINAKVEKWKGAAISYSNLSELELTLGEVAGAVADAEQAVAHADRSGDAFERLSNRATHADALHQAGRRAEAKELFREAEAMQAEAKPKCPLLYSLRGFQYCDLLQARAEQEAGKGGPQGGAGRVQEEAIQACRAVSDRAARTLVWAEQNNLSLLTIALDHLTLGRAALYAAILDPAAAGDQYQSARDHLDDAVTSLRRAGQQDDLPRGLLSRAWLRGVFGPLTGPDSAQADLDEAFEVAARGPMPLHLADIHLYRVRVFLMQSSDYGAKDAPNPTCRAECAKPKEGIPYPWESPGKDLEEARRLVEKHGYWRRKEELEDLEAAFAGLGNRRGM